MTNTTDDGSMPSYERLARIYADLGELQQSEDHDTADALGIVEEIAIDLGLVTATRSNVSYADLATVLEGAGQFFRTRAEDE